MNLGKNLEKTLITLTGSAVAEIALKNLICMSFGLIGCKISS